MKRLFAGWLLSGVILMAGFGNLVAQVTANFTANRVSGCTPLVINFTNTSTGNPTNFFWTFGNGNTSTDPNPSAIYYNPGSYTVSLTVSNGAQTHTETRTAYITVFADPVANFSASDTFGCVPKTISFTDQSTPGTGAIVSWLWDFGDGNISTSQNATHTYANPGFYTVSLLVIDANGCQSNRVRQNYIGISAVPNVNFLANPTNYCGVPSTVQFINSTTGGGNLSYQWEFSGGNTSTLANPSFTYTATGTYSVRLIATNQNGCSDTLQRTNYINVRLATADFSVNTQNVCAGTAVQFTDLSSPNPTNWMWNFGDGNSSTQQNPAHTYAQSGSYTVSLIVLSLNGCYDTLIQQNLIQVNALPQANFGADTTKSCGTPFTVTFTDSSINAVSWSWNFGDGTTSTQQNPVHTYTQNGNFNVELTVTNTDGCQHTFTRWQYIQIIPPTPTFGADVRRGCIDLTVNFTDYSSSNFPLTSWFWDFGDGNTSTSQHPTNVYTQDGIYDVSLTITNSAGCVGTITYPQYIEAGDTPTVNFSGDPRITCLRTSIQFTDSTDFADQWFWDFGDGGNSAWQHPSYQYGDTGTFTVTLIAGNKGCFDTLEQTNYIVIFPPEADFQVAHNCTNPYQVTFTDKSKGGHIWVWAFGDGDSSFVQNPVHTYDTTGNFVVTLTVFDTIGNCYDEHQMTVQIRDPQADFTALVTSGCAPLQVRFNTHSIDAAQHRWYFGDGGTATAQNPLRTYQNPGVYDVTLIVTDIHGCRDTLIRPQYITVYRATAEFSAAPLTGCTPLTINFTDSSSSFMGNIISWEWNFGNGDTSHQQNPAYTYTQPGNFTVSLKVTDSNGCTHTRTRTNFAQPTYPTPGFFSPDTVACMNAPVAFTNTSIGTGISYLWLFGDGDSSTAQHPVHQYSQEGTYDVTLFVTDVNGCDSMIVKPAYIRIREPHAGLMADTTFASCPPLLVNFSDISTGSNIVSWHWDFGNGQSSSLQHPSHVYNFPGVFTVTLIVTSDIGCRDTIVSPDLIAVLGPSGTFTFAPSQGCIPHPVNFNTNVINTAIMTWDFGDGTVYNTTNPTVSHLYNYAGTFYPILILDDGFGCVRSIPPPDSIVSGTVWADFTASDSFFCRNGMVQFTAQTTGHPDITNWFWDFGDGNTSTQQHPVHHFTTPGTFTVTLIASNSLGCSDTITRTDLITIDPGPTAVIDYAPASICQGSTVFFQDISTSDSLIISRLWNFGDGNTASVSNPTHTYAAAGNYVVTLMVETVSGCKDTATTTLTVHPLPPANAGQDVAICIGTSTQLQAAGGVSFSWTPVTGLSDAAIANPVASPTVTTTYTVFVTDQNGCTASDEVTVTVNPLPVVTVNQDTTICVNAFAQLTATGGVQYAWSPATSLNNPLIANPQASPVATTTYMVTVTDANGCSATGSVTVNVNPLPVISINPNQAICIGDTAQLQASGGDSFSWNPVATLTASNIAAPLAFPINTTTYTVTVTDSNLCVNTQSTVVTVNPLPNVQVSPDVSICPGDSTQLMVSPAVSYQWTPASGLSCTNCQNPMASPNATTTYTVEVTNQNGCKRSGSVTVTVHALANGAITGNNAICFGESTTLSATGGISYQWSPAATLSQTTGNVVVATPTTTTTYFVDVTDQNGCVLRDSITVTVNPLPVVSVSPNMAICLGDSAVLSAQGGNAWLWSPAADLSDPMSANPVAKPQQTTTFTVQVTDQNGCIDSAFTTLTVNPLPVVTLTQDSEICIGENIQLIASGGITFDWQPANGLSCTNCPNPIANPFSTTGYTVEVTDANGCKNTGQVTVTVHPLPVPVVSPAVTICSGASVTITASGGIAYEWIQGTNLSCTTCPSPIVNPDSTTTYVVRVTSANGCHAFDSVTVTVLQYQAAFGQTQTAACLPASVQLTNLAQADEPITSIWWSFGDGTGSSVVNPVKTYNYPGVYTISQIIQTASGCRDTAQSQITVHPLPVADAGPDAAICLGENIQLQATGGTAYLWTPANSLDNDQIANPVATPTVTTDYVVRVMDANNCFGYDTVRITVNPLPVAQVSSDTAVCYGNYVSLWATGGIQYSWFPFTGLDDAASQTPLATPLQTTVYSVTVTDANGCTDTASVTLTVESLPLIALSPDTAVCINESVQLAASGGIDYFWSPSTGLNCTNCPDPIATPLTTTVYSVEVTGQNGCTNRDSVTITVNPVPVATISGDTVICFGSGTTLTATGGTDYFWSPATGLSCTNCPSPIAAPDSTQVYSVTVISADGCEAQAAWPITVIRPIAAIQSSPTAACVPAVVSFTDASVANEPIVSWHWDFGDGNISQLQNPTHTWPNSGTYAVSLNITTLSGCTHSDTVQITAFALPIANAGPDVTICAGESAMLNGSGGISWSWSPAADLDNPTSQTPRATPSATTDFVLTVMDGNGCQNTDTVTVTVNPLPVATLTPDTAICQNEQIQLTATGGDTYTWQTNATLSCLTCYDPVASPVSTTTYSVQISNNFGCNVQQSVTVTVEPLPQLLLSPNVDICQGTATSLTATGADIYTWTPAANLDCNTCPTVNANPATTTTYVVEGMSLFGCSVTDSVTVTVHEIAADFAQSDSAGCRPLSVQFTDQSVADRPIVSHVWTIGATDTLFTANPSWTFTQAGTFDVSLTVSTAFGCSDTKTKTVEIFDLPLANTGPDLTICEGQTVQINGTASGQVVWIPATGLSNGNISNPVANPSITTTYVMEVTSGSGCINRDTITVTVNNLPTINIGGVTTICQNEATQLFATGASQYSWTPAAGLSCTQCSDPIANPATTTTYTVVGTDQAGCENQASVTVTVQVLPNGQLVTTDTAICAGASVQLVAVGGDSYSWSPAQGLSCTNCPNPVATPANSQLYVVEITNALGCSIWDSIWIETHAFPVVTGGNDKDICPGDSVQLQVAGADNYAWLTLSEISCLTCPNPVVWPTQTRDYVVHASTAFGCSLYDTIRVNVHPNPIIDAGEDVTICVGGSVRLPVSGGNAYQWSPADGLDNPLSAHPIASPATTTVYTVTGTGDFGCKSSADVIVFVVDKYEVEVTGDTTICVGGVVQLNATMVGVPAGNISWNWTPDYAINATNIPNPIVKPATSTVYRLIAGTEGCPPDTQYVTIKVNPIPDVNAGPDKAVPAGTEIILEGSGSLPLSQIIWYPEDGLSCINCYQPKLTATGDRWYYITGKDEAGCEATDTVWVRVYNTCEPGQIWLPNTFTPNGDERNDKLFVRGFDIDRLVIFRVYNRWGELVFETKNINDGWDGTHNGKPANPGVFVYYVEAYCSENQIMRKQGNVTLLR